MDVETTVAAETVGRRRTYRLRVGAVMSDRSMRRACADSHLGADIRRGRTLGDTVAQPLRVGQRTRTPANRAPHKPVIADCAMNRGRADTCLGRYRRKRDVLSDITSAQPARIEASRLLRVWVPVLPTAQQSWTRRDGVLTNRPVNDLGSDTGLLCDLTQRHLIDFVTLTQPVRINLLGPGSFDVTTNVMVA